MTLPSQARRFVHGAVGFAALAGLLVIPLAWALAEAIDRAFLGGADLTGVWTLLAAAAALAVGRALATWAADALAARASFEARASVREALTSAVLARGPLDAATASAGYVSTTVVGGVDQLDGYVRLYLPQRALAVGVPATILVVVALVDPLSAVVLGFTYPLIPVFMVLIGSSARERTERQFSTLTRLGARFLDAVQGLPTLHLFNGVERERARLAAIADRFRELTMEVLRLAFVSAFVLEFLATISTAVIAVEVGLRLLYGRIPFDEALLVLMLAPEFYKPLRALGAAYHAGASGTAAWEQVQGIIGTARVAAVPVTHACGPRGARGRPPVDAAEGICVEHAITVHDLVVDFGTGRGAALSGVSLSIAAGRVTAIVGPSGAGKSTLVHALLGFVTPERGEIRVDGQALADLGLERWRRSVGWVPQHPHVFHGSVRSNLGMGAGEATDADMHTALAAVGLDAWLATLPAGLETPLAERGADLSGGQAQRLAIARALVRGASVLVFDEPTAHLDADAEAEVLTAIDRVRHGRTVVVVAHRSAVVSRADTVIALAAGRVTSA